MQKTETPSPVDPNRSEAIARLGQEMYESHVLPKIRPEDDGRFVAVDVNSGDFIFLNTPYSTLLELRARRPNALLWITRVGGPVADDPRPIDLSRMEFKRIAKIVNRGERIYESHVRPQLRPEDDGLWVAVDVDTGDFEIHSDHDAAVRTLRERRSTANIFGTTVRPVASQMLPVEVVDP